MSTLTRSQIGGLECEIISEAVRDIEDVLQQMGVNPANVGFIARIRSPIGRIKHLTEQVDPTVDNVVKLEGLRKVPALRVVDELQGRIDPAEPFLKAMLATRDQTIPTINIDRPCDSEPSEPPGAA